jgi:transcriptional regulator with XRE-family HTH domain
MAKKFRDLVAQMSPERQAEAAARTAELLRAMPLYELRQARRLSQEELASTLETSQSSISKLERRVDVYVSTLRRYVESLGGELDIIARFPDGSVRINQFEQLGDEGPERVRDRVAAAGVSEADVDDAVAWARRKKR